MGALGHLMLAESLFEVVTKLSSTDSYFYPPDRYLPNKQMQVDGNRSQLPSTCICFLPLLFDDRLAWAAITLATHASLC